MAFYDGIEKSKMGLEKVNLQGSKDETGKDQWLFPRNFMLIHLGMP
jgi:hypothetical protein